MCASDDPLCLYLPTSLRWPPITLLRRSPSLTPVDHNPPRFGRVRVIDPLSIFNLVSTLKP